MNESAPVDTSLAFKTKLQNGQGADWLDVIVAAYLLIPLTLFFAGWFRPWVSIAMICFLVLPFILVVRTGSSGAWRRTSLRVMLLCFSTAAMWAYLGGIGHFRYANEDWLIRDAVLRDLVVSPWPVGYGDLHGQSTVLRTTLAYFLPAAALGKLIGLQAAQWCLLVWTALGAGLFFLQCASVLPARRGAIAITLMVIVLFSGMDIIGSVLNGGENFISSWTVSRHLEWWAKSYQYSSMTTQLFWVPNHALGGWLFVGLLVRSSRVTYGLLPLVMVALILWSPLAAAGAVPFALWCYATSGRANQPSLGVCLLTWTCAALVAIPVVGYVTMDLARVHSGFLSLSPISFARWLQFFFLEIGILGGIACVLRPWTPCIIALIVLLVLPVASVGAGVDLVMRASIPSLAVVAICVCRVLIARTDSASETACRWIMIACVCVGAVTPMQEIARGFVRQRWDPRLAVSLVGASCGHYFSHYIARVDESRMRYLLRAPHMLPLGPQSPEFCGATDEYGSKP